LRREFRRKKKALRVRFLRGTAAHGSRRIDQKKDKGALRMTTQGFCYKREVLRQPLLGKKAEEKRSQGSGRRGKAQHRAARRPWSASSQDSYEKGLLKKGDPHQKKKKKRLEKFPRRTPPHRPGDRMGWAGRAENAGTRIYHPRHRVLHCRSHSPDAGEAVGNL